MNLKKFRLPAAQRAGVAAAQSAGPPARRLTKLDRELAKDQSPLALIDPTGAALGDLLVFDGEKYRPSKTALSLTITQSLLVATVQHVGSLYGAFSATPTTKPTVTGSRGGNAALASLLTALATLGWITDSTTA